MIGMTNENIAQYITEKDFAEQVFDAKIIGGRLRECAFYLETYKMKFGQEDLIQISILGYPFKAMVVSIAGAEGGLSYIKCLVKWGK
jgi:hypothetical protein